jgi:hypothetical protein
VRTVFVAEMGSEGIQRSAAICAAALALLLAPAAAAAESAELPTRTEIQRGAERFVRAHGDTVPPELPRANTGPGTTDAVLPSNRVVALYGAPQMGQTILGLTSPAGAARKLRAQSAPYGRLGDRPVVGAFDLVSVFATAGGGPDGLYRTRQSDDVISIYLEQARAAGARLILDIQPGRSTFIEEIRKLEEWIAEPDVDVALDAEWNVGRSGIPGSTDGKTTAGQVNRARKEVARIVRANDLPPKLLVVHQFARGSIRQRKRITTTRDVQVLLNFDGIGSPAPKESGYAALSAPQLFDGFSLFYRRDTPLMTPAQVLGLEPAPDLLLYQ